MGRVYSVTNKERPSPQTKMGFVLLYGILNFFLCDF